MPRDPDDIRFSTVPRRSRRDGWTPEVQRAFIRVLRKVGSVTMACKAVGRSPRSAYNLLKHPQSNSFASAWCNAVFRGRDNLRDQIIDRCFNGAVVPRFRNGKQVGTVHRYYDQLAASVLSGRDVEVERMAAVRESNRAYRNSDVIAEWRAEEQATLAEAKKRALDARQALVDAEQERRDAAARERPGPRVTFF